MNDELKKIFEISSDAVLYICGGKIEYSNCAADELFARELSGCGAYGIIPDGILAESAESFVASAEIKGRRCRVGVSRLGPGTVLSIRPQEKPESTLDMLSDQLVSSMMSSLFNIGLSIDLVSGRLPEAMNDEKIKQYVSILYHNYYSVKRLMSNVSTARALDAGTIDFMPRSTDLALLCSDIVSTASVMLGRGPEIDFATDHGELIANVDPDKIERMLLNLISNSFAATPEGGKISIRLRSGGNRAVISVDDSGCGIAPDVLRNVFTRYENGGSGTLTDMPRCGLGLGIARGIAELHGGTLIIESREGRGTSVRVMLPLDLPGAVRFNSTMQENEPTGMDNILTELSGILPSRCYADRFRD